jgi:hypothetical protein
MQAGQFGRDAQKKTKTLSNKLKAVEASTDTRPTDDGIRMISVAPGKRT